MRQAFALAGLLAAASCHSPAAPITAAAPAADAPAPPTASAVQQAVAAYIKANAAAFSGYEPVRWGRPLAYTKSSEAARRGMLAMQRFDEALGPRSKAFAVYRASLARHEPPARTQALKARYDKAARCSDSLLAAAATLSGVQDTTRLGTAIMHAYRTKAKSGFMVLDSAVFVVDASGRVEQL